MTKEEIYKYINYQGKYDINVKRRLKKLIKKYHPDLNNGDDKVMKLINEVKIELESKKGSSSYKDFTPFKVSKTKFSKQDVLTITLLINKLKKEIKELNQKINGCYHDEYELYRKYNSSLSIYNQILLKRELIFKKISNLKKFTRGDKLNLLIIILLGLISLYSFNYVVFICLFFFIYIVIIINIIRIYKVRNLKKELISIDSNLEKYKSDIAFIKMEIDKLKFDMFQIKKSTRNKYSSVRVYEKMLSDDNSDNNKESYKQK